MFVSGRLFIISVFIACSADARIDFITYNIIPNQFGATIEMCVAGQFRAGEKLLLKMPFSELRLKHKTLYQPINDIGVMTKYVSSLNLKQGYAELSTLKDCRMHKVSYDIKNLSTAQENDTESIKTPPMVFAKNYAMVNRSAFLKVCSLDNKKFFNIASKVKWITNKPNTNEVCRGYPKGTYVCGDIGIIDTGNIKIIYRKSSSGKQVANRALKTAENALEKYGAMFNHLPKKIEIILCDKPIETGEAFFDPKNYQIAVYNFEKHTINHEIMHAYIDGSITKKESSNMEDAFFEGFTEFFARKIGGKQESIKAFNDYIDCYEKAFKTPQSVYQIAIYNPALFYIQGCIIAMYLNEKISAKSAGRFGLHNVIADMLGKTYSEELLIAALEKYGVASAHQFVDRYIHEGYRIPLEELDSDQSKFAKKPVGNRITVIDIP